jgi:hypothetical protein
MHTFGLQRWRANRFSFINCFIVIQNTNAYEVGFTKAWDGFRNAVWKNRLPEKSNGKIYLYGRKKLN